MIILLSLRMPLMLADNNKRTLNAFLLAFGYCIVFYCFHMFLYKISIAPTFPEDVSLLRYDAGIYRDISKVGYTYNDPQFNTTGCYILFPWVWHLLHVGVMGMCFFNIVFFAIGFSIMVRLYPVSSQEQFLWLSIPSLYFMMVPYTEALFCILTALSFYGIATHKKWLSWVALFLLSLTRATAVFLIPALLLMEFLTSERRDLPKVILNYLVQYALPTLAGLAVFVLVQYYQTGVWFAYYKQQVNYLGHKWAWPILPFSNFYSAPRVNWLSGMALLVCMTALIALCIKCFKWLFRREKQNDKVLILTLTYLSITMFVMIFCNPIWGSGTTNLLGLHRYTFCTPFIFVFLYYYANGIKNYKALQYVLMFFLCCIVWLSMGAYAHLQYFLFWSFNTLLVMGYMARSDKRAWITTALVAVNVVIQVSLFQQYLGNFFTD